MSSSPPPLAAGSSKRVAVVGAGASGLAAAYKLKSNGIDVTVYEADSRAGGKIKSNSRNGFIWDEGANTMTEIEADVGFLLDSLKIRDKQQLPLSQHKCYIAKDGSPMLLPSNPIALLGSSVLSTHSKFQVFLEPFLWKKSEPSKQESVGNFFQHHFGKEVVDNIIDPFLAGTTGGDPESLSIRHTFPDLWNLEKRYGSIIYGAVLSKVFGKKEGSAKIKNNAGGRKRTRGSSSFFGGMMTLTDALCEELGKDVLKLQSKTLTDALCEELGKDVLKLQSKVLEFSSILNEGSSLDGWSISYESPGKKQAEKKSYDAVIVTAPLSSVKDMKFTKRGVPFLLDFIPEINYISMSVITTAFRKERVERPLEGFGVLIPSKETQNGLRTLGTLFSSMMFPDRSPSDMYLYTTFVGGTRNRELTKASWDELKGIVIFDLQKLLGAKGEPVFVMQYNWNKAFPLYGHNYHLAVEAIDKLEKNLPGFFYAGNHKGGLSVGKAISSGCHAADLVISYLNSCSDKKINFLET